MIADHIQHAAQYYSLGERFRDAFKYLQSTDFSIIPLEKQSIRGEEVFALPQQYETKLRHAGKWESHRRYADIQYLVSGREQMGVAQLEAMRVIEAYNAEKDYMFLEGAGQFLNYAAGNFAVYFPHDVHMPGLAIDAPELVKKVVVKVEL
jgi:YhcH/YjgK/YiaL family protein